MDFKNGVVNIQATGYHGICTVVVMGYFFQMPQVFLKVNVVTVCLVENNIQPPQ